MLVYRLGNTEYAHDLTGDGARINGGRWNHLGVPVLYTSQSRALAVLEFSVNVNIERIIRNLSMTIIEIPEDIHEINVNLLPGNWRDYPAPVSTKDFGTQILYRVSHAIIKIPSTVIPQEFNYLINPLHTKSRLCKIKEVIDFVYDIRIKSA